jgi:hypothetical protein
MADALERGNFRRWVTPTFVVVVVCLLYVAIVLINAHGDPLSFVLLGARFSEGDPQGSEGYDGQFVYQIALRPLKAVPYLDVPAYRYQRVLYPTLARLLAFGRPELIPWTLIIINVLAIGLGTRATELLLVKFGAGRWYALVYGLYSGQLLALRTDLNEPLAHALVQLAMLAWARERRWLAGMVFGLAALSKETTLVFLAAYLVFALMRCEWRQVIGLGIGVIPFVLYQFLLWAWLGDFGVGSGGAGATPFSLIPLGGYLAMIRVKLAAFLVISLIVFPVSVLPAIIGTALSLRDLFRGENHPFILCLLLNSLVILFLPTSTFREPAAMLRLTQGLMACMLLYGALVKSSRILNYSLLWLLSNVLLFKGIAGPG